MTRWRRLGLLILILICTDPLPTHAIDIPPFPLPSDSTLSPTLHLASVTHWLRLFQQAYGHYHPLVLRQWLRVAMAYDALNQPAVAAQVYAAALDTLIFAEEAGYYAYPLSLRATFCARYAAVLDRLGQTTLAEQWRTASNPIAEDLLDELHEDWLLLTDRVETP